MGKAGCFSFFPSKNLGAFGDAGLLTTNDEALAHEVRLLRNHGAEPKYFHKRIGGNFRLDALQAAVLRVKLPHLEGWTRAPPRERRPLRSPVRARARPRIAITLPARHPDCRHIFNQYVDPRAAIATPSARASTPRGIGTEIYYPVPFHLQECFAPLGYRQGTFPRPKPRPRKRSRCRSTAS